VKSERMKSTIKKTRENYSKKVLKTR